MGQPVKLSDELVDDARAVVPFSQRSIAGQIEYWAGLGKSIEPLLLGDRALTLQIAGGTRPLSELIAEVGTTRGRKRLHAVLKKRPYPHFKPVAGHPELICRIEEDGSETTGRFVGREFIAVRGPTLSLPFSFLDKRPIIIALAGSNGAGKSTFYESHLSDAGLRFINADDLSASLGLAPYEAAELATSIRRELVNQRESFIFETVLYDPVGEKVDQLASCASLGYTVVLIFIRIESADQSIRRVAMRACQGGHDVPDDKLRARFERTLANLQRAIERLPHFPDKRKGPILNESSVMAVPNNLRSVVEKPHLLGVNRQISNQPRGITRVSTQSSLFHLLLSHVLRNLHPQIARSFFRKPTDPLRCG